jgi:VIT1/CCC1 family predicted Fe2+/Mn2+ transporter
MQDEKARYLERLYRNEMRHMRIYAKFAQTEKHKELRKILETLSAMEAKHAKWWAEILELNRLEPETDGTDMTVSSFVFLRRLFGLALTIKIIEYMEMGLERQFDNALKNMKLAPREKEIIKRIKDDENKSERALEERVMEYGKFLNNVRDIIFGMNDGLVELLAVVVGLAAALTNPVLILLGGFIVSVSGTLSMAGGAYISTEYEAGIIREERRTAATTPLKSAFYVGIMYFVGTLFPLSPFILGLTGYTAIAMAIIVTAVVLTIASTIIALVSNTSIGGRVAKTLLISLGIAAMTILIGMYARSILHLPAGL